MRAPSLAPGPSEDARSSRLVSLDLSDGEPRPEQRGRERAVRGRGDESAEIKVKHKVVALGTAELEIRAMLGRG